jgi:hypothetical protein
MKKSRVSKSATHKEIGVVDSQDSTSQTSTFPGSRPRLQLRRETIRRLTAFELSAVHGGEVTTAVAPSQAGDPSCRPHR